MRESLSKFHEWFDRDFFKLGAFLTSYDGQTVSLAKGGSFEFVDKFLETDEPIFYLKDFYKNIYIAYRPREVLTVGRNEIPTLENEHSHFSPLSNDDDIYEKDFSGLKSAFNQGLQKVVLISRETFGSFEGEKTIRHLFNRAFSFGTGIPYGMWNSQYGVIGSTPELLYNVTGEALTTFALAGTAIFGQEQSLLESKKDRHEHDLVIQDISEKLKSFVNSLKVGETKIHPFKSIVHLKTDIKAELKPGTNFTDFTNCMSPTAALGGYPKRESLNFLKSTLYSREYSNRFFGSAFGLMTPINKEFVVSIRNVQWESAHLFIESGGGIVQESEFSKELAEIHLKRAAIRKHYL